MGCFQYQAYLKRRRSISFQKSMIIWWSHRSNAVVLINCLHCLNRHLKFSYSSNRSHYSDNTWNFIRKINCRSSWISKNTGMQYLLKRSGDWSECFFRQHCIIYPSPTYTRLIFRLQNASMVAKGYARSIGHISTLCSTHNARIYIVGRVEKNACRFFA